MTVAGPLELPTIARHGILLRPWRLADAPALRLACGDEDIMRFTTIPAVYSEESAVEWVVRQRKHAERGTAIVLAVVGPDEARPLGVTGLFGLDREEPVARLGYWLVRDARGRGLATASARALIEWGFERLDLEQVIIEREPRNLASARVAEKLGAARTGTRLVECDHAEVELIRYVVTPPG